MVDYPKDDGLPVVASRTSSNLGVWVFAAILLVGGLWLFLALSANRTASEVPVTSARPMTGGPRITAAPPLALPTSMLAAQQRILGPAPPARIVQRAPERVAARPRPAPVAPRTAPIPVQPLPASPLQPSVVFDSAFRNAPQAATSTAASGSQDRVTAGRFANPSQTIPQGTVIPAVLETALDSTRPGAARALVQRDVYSFDGTRVLIHRGSRIYGEYESGLEAGQNRTMITWTRLIRPDGVTIELDSPSSDPLGRAGVKGDVDSKFLQRFGGAILQSVLDIGVGLATREVSGDGVLVALPGSTQNLQVQQRESVQRTLKVRHGTSVSVFVARDLDFSTVDF